jgi:hypothetical protein
MPTASEEQERLEKEARERQRAEAEAAEKERRAKEEEARRQAAAAAETERRRQEAAAAERRRAEAEAARAEQQRQYEEEQRRLQEEEERRLAEQQAAEERARQEEARTQAEADAQKVNEYLTSHGFKGGVNAKKKSIMKYQYPLHIAVKEQNPEMVKLLIEQGADATLKNASGRTPGDKAEQYTKKKKGDATSVSIVQALGGC